MYYVHVLLSLTTSFPFLSKFASLIKVCGQNEWTLLFKTHQLCYLNTYAVLGVMLMLMTYRVQVLAALFCLKKLLLNTWKTAWASVSFTWKERESDWNGDREKIKNVLAAGCNCQLQFGCLHVDSQHSHNKDEARQQRHLPRNNSILYLFVN